LSPSSVTLKNPRRSSDPKSSLSKISTFSSSLPLTTSKLNTSFQTGLESYLTKLDAAFYLSANKKLAYASTFPVIDVAYSSRASINLTVITESSSIPNVFNLSLALYSLSLYKNYSLL
jgi:hypothetical protein